MSLLLLLTVAGWVSYSFSAVGNTDNWAPAKPTRRLLIPEPSLESGEAKAVAIATATSSDGKAEAVASATAVATSKGAAALATAEAITADAGDVSTTAVATPSATLDSTGSWNASMCLWAPGTCSLNPSYLFSLPPPELGAER